MDKIILAYKRELANMRNTTAEQFAEQQQNKKTMKNKKSKTTLARVLAIAEIALITFVLIDLLAFFAIAFAVALS